MSKPALVVTTGREYTPHPRRVRLTPELATALLERNTMNRPLRKGHAEELARRMKAGLWKFNNASIGVATNGDILDGQHRLWAVVESGVTIETLIVEGLDPDVFATIDTGRPRSASDVFHIAGGKNNTTIAAALRLLWWYSLNPRPHISSIKVSHDELLAFRGDNPDFDEAARVVASTKNARRIVTQSVVCFVYAMAARTDEAKAGAWLASLDSGAGLDPKHPVLQLRERMLANRISTAKLPPLDVLALAVKSWNQYLTGKRTATLRWANTEPFPEFASPRIAPPRR